MKKIIMCLIILPFLSALHAEATEQAEKIVIASNSLIDFSSVPNSNDYPFVITTASFEMMNNGETQLLLSDKKWTDELMADYKQRYKSLPLVLTIASFSKVKEASLQQQSEIFSGRTGDKMLYLYITNETTYPVREALGLHFSEVVQSWFSEHDMMAIPEAIQQQNRVELGLLLPKFVGGYK